MQHLLDNQEKKIRAIESRISAITSQLHHTNPKNETKVEYLLYLLQSSQDQLQYEKAELKQLRKRLAKLPALMQQIKNTQHHNLTKAERDRQRYKAKQQKARERYLRQLNNTTNA